MKYQVLTAPHPNLRKIAKPVNKVDKKLLQNQELLIQALKDEQDPIGVGMAFTQINKLIRGFAFRTDTDNELKLDENMIVIFNPELIAHSSKLTLGQNEQDPDIEGCLSVPTVFGPVLRWPWVELKYQLIENNKLVTYQKKFQDYEARIMQHELDHLNGVLFTDHLLEQRQPVYLQKDGELVQAEDTNFLKVY